MMFRSVMFRSVGLAVVLVAWATSAHAALSVKTKFLGASPKLSGITATLNGVQLTLTAGQMNWKLLSESSPDALMQTPNSTFSTFCIEVNQFVSTNSNYNYNIVHPSAAPLTGSGTWVPGDLDGNGPMAAARASLLGELWANYHGTIAAAATLSAKNVLAAAFQMAIWEIVYDGATPSEGLTLAKPASGDPNYATRGKQFWVKRPSNSATGNDALIRQAFDTAQGWLAAIGPDGLLNNKTTYIVALSSLTAQDQITEQAPEPATFVAWSVLGLVFGGAHVVRRRRASSAFKG
jgi:hypothetical protein